MMRCGCILIVDVSTPGEITVLMCTHSNKGTVFSVVFKIHGHLSFSVTIQ